MNNHRKHPCFIAALFLFISSPVSASDGSSNQFNLDEVAQGVYVHTGLHVAFEDPQHDDIANIGFIIGEKCIAVIDTGGSVNVGRKLIDRIKATSEKPVCYVINTHVHFDHVLGNVIFKSDATRFVGHVDLPDAMAANRDFFIREFTADLGNFASLDGIIAPSVVVEDRIELDLGNRVLELRAWPTAHSHTDITVLDKKTNTLWLSDLLFIDRIPALDGSLKGWLKVIDQLEQQNFNVVIPGHGPVTSHWPESIQAEKQYLTLLLEGTRKMIAAGAFMEDVVETLGKEEQKAWLLYEQHHKRNVTRAFTELEWE